MNEPSRDNDLSLEEKRKLVYNISDWSQGADELLQSWSRQELLQILCAEMGKERKYTGLTKLKIIENLLKVVSEKKSQEDKMSLESEPSSATGNKSAKRPRKSDHPNRLNIAADTSSMNIVGQDVGSTRFCKNLACRGKLSQQDAFCKRCSCCICFQFDDNKDPTLWLSCSSDPPFQGNSCGMSCHLECALRHKKAGILKDAQSRGLDGCFYCVSCGKVNDLLGCWRKQMTVSRDTRRVDILCYRISLSQKLLVGTKCYKRLHEFVEEATKKLEAEVGPLTGLPVKRARGIVNRLSSGQEVQRLCASAVESVDSILCNTSFNMVEDPADALKRHISTPPIRFESISPSSISVIFGSDDPYMATSVVDYYSLWHRKVEDVDYQVEPTCTLFAPSSRFLLSGLFPATKYSFKVVAFRGTWRLWVREAQFETFSVNTESDKMSNEMNLDAQISNSPATNSSSLSNPSSVEDENNNVIGCEKRNDSSNDVLGCNGSGQCGPHEDSLSILDNVVMTKENSLPNSDTANLLNEHSPQAVTIEKTSTKNKSNDLELGPAVHVPEVALPITPSKMENSRGGLGKNPRPKPCNKDLVNGPGRDEEQQDGSSSKKTSGERQYEECAENVDRDFGYYVKIIRWLECEGHIETSFRQKFLTWYSLRATPQEMRIVRVFVDTLMEDPASLAGQLVDTFSEVIISKRGSVVPAGFCIKLWH